jgi:hypothetical protein
MKREFRGIWIPAELWINTDLSWTEKVMLREIDSLSHNDEAGCYASNGYFSDFFNLSKSRISDIVSSLVHKKYVSAHLVRYTEDGHIKTKRLLKTTGKGLRKTDSPYSENRKAYSGKRKGQSGNGECINTLNNTKKNPVSAPIGASRSKEQLGELLDRMSGKFAFPEKKKPAGESPGAKPPEDLPPVA